MKNLAQSRKIGVAGSFQNQLMGNNNSIPVVGEYATHLMYSDRYPYKVIEVSEDCTKVKLMYLQVTQTEKGIFCEPTEGFMNIEYRRGAWYTVSTVVTFEKKFRESREAEHGKMFGSYLLTEEEKTAVYFNEITQHHEMFPQNIIPGVTKAKKEYSKISILFEAKPNYYYDPSF